MKSIIQTRFLHWKHHFYSFVFWLFFPLASVIFLHYLLIDVQTESKVPVGLVVEDQTNTAFELVKELKQSSLLRIYELDKDKALQQLKKHELDSVFIIKDGYEEKMYRGSRNRLITSYQSDLSFAYTSVSEMVASFVQKNTGRIKTAHTVLQLEKQLTNRQDWTKDEIITTSKEIETNQNLLSTQLQYQDQVNKREKQVSLWNPWGIWILFASLATFFLFDWVIKENNATVKPRFVFIRFSFKKYALLNLTLYTCLLLFIDVITIFVFHYILDIPTHFSQIIAIVTIRMILNGFAFLFAFKMKRLVTYYSLSFIITLLLALTSGAIIPIDHLVKNLPTISVIHPFIPFLEGALHNIWLYIVGLLIIIWYARREDTYA